MTNQRLAEATQRLKGIVEEELLPDIIDTSVSPQQTYVVRLERAHKHAPAYENVYDAYGQLVQSIYVPAGMVRGERVEIHPLKQ